MHAINPGTPALDQVFDFSTPRVFADSETHRTGLHWFETSRGRFCVGRDQEEAAYMVAWLSGSDPQDVAHVRPGATLRELLDSETGVTEVTLQFSS